MGIGFLLRIMSVVCTLIMDIEFHVNNRKIECMFNYDLNTNSSYLDSDFKGALVYLQDSLYSLSNMLLYVGLYQFVCAQSPQSMKGLLIGLSFAIRGLFQLLPAALLIPFVYIQQSFPSCGMDYYLMNVVVGVVAVVLYVHVAKRYKLRERD